MHSVYEYKKQINKYSKTCFENLIVYEYEVLVLGKNSCCNRGSCESGLLIQWDWYWCFNQHTLVSIYF